jgi:threonine/homoserine/homoserine lactone efflux protein
MLQDAITLLFFLAPLAYSPGPGNAYFAAIGARYGLRGAVSPLIGYHLATFVVTLLFGLSFGAISSVTPQVLSVLRYAGGAYVLYLAFLLIKSGATELNTQPQAATFTDGLVLLLLNPKAYLIISLMFSQFLVEQQAVDWWRVTWITTIFTLNNLVAFLLWAYAGDVLAAQFRDPRKARQLNIVLGVMLGAVSVWMLVR